MAACSIGNGSPETNSIFCASQSDGSDSSSPPLSLSCQEVLALKKKSALIDCVSQIKHSCHGLSQISDDVIWMRVTRLHHRVSSLKLKKKHAELKAVLESQFHVVKSTCSDTVEPVSNELKDKITVVHQKTRTIVAESRVLKRKLADAVEDNEYLNMLIDGYEENKHRLLIELAAENDNTEQKWLTSVEKRKR